MAAKKKTEEVDLDAILLRQVAERRSPTGSVLDFTSDASAGMSPQTSMPAQREGAEPPKDSATAQTSRTRRASGELSAYELLFLHPHVVQQRSAIYISANTKDKITEVVRHLGMNRISVTTYAENILSHHLELFRDEINRLHRQKNTKDIL